MKNFGNTLLYRFLDFIVIFRHLTVHFYILQSDLCDLITKLHTELCNAWKPAVPPQ